MASLDDFSLPVFTKLITRASQCFNSPTLAKGSRGKYRQASMPGEDYRTNYPRGLQLNNHDGVHTA